MKLAIIQVVLWHRSGNKAPRTVTFQDGALNLITGESGTGKTAILKIIDYCLGSRGCDIPKVGPIRRSCGWYGVLVVTDEGQKLIVRRDPGDHEATDECMLVEGPTVEVPPRPSQNANRSMVIALLARLAHLPQAGTDFDRTGSGFKGRASFGDMMAFVFQTQSIVASEITFFFESQIPGNAQKLREVFPLVLGAVDADILVRQYRLAEVRRQLDSIRRRQNALRRDAEDYVAELRGRYVTAASFGLIETDIDHVEAIVPDVLLQRLRTMAQTWKVGSQDLTQGTGLFVHADRLSALRDAAPKLAAEVLSLRRRLTQIVELRRSRGTHGSTLARQRDRLAPVSWVLSTIRGQSDCPFCGAPNVKASKELRALERRTREVETQWTTQLVPPALDEEEVQVGLTLTHMVERLQQTQVELDLLEKDVEKGQPVQHASEERATFMGRLEEFLRTTEQLESDSELTQELTELEAEEAALKGAIDGESIEDRRDDALLQISSLAQKYSDIVELETGRDPIHCKPSTRGVA